MIAHHFHHHRAIAGEVYPPEGHRIHWQGMAFFCRLFLWWNAYIMVVLWFFGSTAISHEEHDET